MKQMTLSVLIVMLFSTFIYAQTSKLDSLENCLKKELARDSNKVNTLLDAANIYYSSAPEKLLAYAREAEILADSVGFARGIARSLLVIGNYYMAVANYPLALEFYNKASKKYKDNNDLNGVAKAYYNTGTIFRLQGKYADAMESNKKALAIRLKIGDKKEISLSYLLIGVLAHAQLNLPMALENYQKALKLCKEINYNTGATHCLNNIGNIYAEQKEYDLSLEYHKKALNIREQNNDANGIASSCNNIADLYLLQNDYDNALLFLERSLKLRLEINDVRGVALSNFGIGYIHSASGDFTQALKYFETSLAECITLGIKKQEAMNYIGLGGLYLKHGNPSKAYQYAEKAYSIANETKVGLLITQSTELLAKCCDDLELYEEAYDYYVIFKEMSDSSINESSIKAITNLENQYQFDKEKETIAVEQAKKDTLQIAEAKRQKQLRNSFIGGAFIFLLLSLIILRSLIQKRKSNLLLAIKNNEIEAQAQELKASNASLVELSSFKEDITNMVVHDLKNPISSIVNIDFIEDESQRIETVKHAGHKMMNLVQNILDVYKYKSLEMELDKSPVNLSSVINQAIAEVAFIAKQRQLEFQINLKHNTQINADESIIRRTLVNILSNAVKFAPQNSKITISAHIESNNNLRLSIHNSGLHIPKDKQQHIFEKFGQFEKRKQGQVHSTGLGLAFCQLAVKAHQGEMSVLSAENQGVEFWITLPEAAIIDQLDPMELESSSPKKLISLTQTEKDELSQILPLLVKLSVNELSAFRKTFEIIKAKNLGNPQWETALEEAVYNCNQEQFQYLVSLIKK